LSVFYVFNFFIRIVLGGGLTHTLMRIATFGVSVFNLVPREISDTMTAIIHMVLDFIPHFTEVFFFHFNREFNPIPPMGTPFCFDYFSFKVVATFSANA
jgi:hypothetical protein